MAITRICEAVGGQDTGLQGVVDTLDAMIDSSDETTKKRNDTLSKVKDTLTGLMKEGFEGRDWSVKAVTFDVAVKDADLSKLSGAGSGSGHGFYNAFYNFLQSQGMELAGDIFDVEDADTKAYIDNDYTFFEDEEPVSEGFDYDEDSVLDQTLWDQISTLVADAIADAYGIREFSPEADDEYIKAIDILVKVVKMSKDKFETPVIDAARASKSVEESASSDRHFTIETDFDTYGYDTSSAKEAIDQFHKEVKDEEIRLVYDESDNYYCPETGKEIQDEALIKDVNVTLDARGFGGSGNDVSVLGTGKGLPGVGNPK